jgi:two-component system, OmpR family, copper resistance phosphate regulon response regulator CusR
MEILVVEDQKGMLQSIKQGLEEMNLKVDVATNGIEGKNLALKKSYNVIILDILMPELNGLELCKILRQSGCRTPILFISALDSVEDKISGLEAGGDDYLAKPFEFNEFAARIMALNRRNQSDYLTAGSHIIDNLEVNFETKTAYRNKTDLELTKKEFRLLEYFIKNEGRILTKTEIAGNVWDVDFDTGTNVVEVYVNYLRNKLDKMYEKKLIHTKFGIGYIFNPK